MASGLEVSPDPLKDRFRRQEQKPDHSDSDGDLNNGSVGHLHVRDPVEDSDSDLDETVDEKVFLIPDPISNTAMYSEGFLPVSPFGSIQMHHSDTEYLASLRTINDESDELFLLQAQVFLEDAAMYRSIDHRVDFRSLRIYQFYHSRPFSLFRSFVIVVLHMLAFFEFPSSLTWTSDIRTSEKRVELPCGVTQSIELLCLAFLMADFFIKSRIYGNQHILTNRWLLVAVVALAASFVDWSVSLAMGCKEVVRVRRMLRPVFIIQNSSLMKKIINSLRKSVSQILGVLMLMFLHLYIFTLFGMLLFPKQSSTSSSPGSPDDLDAEAKNGNQSGNGTQNDPESAYFRTLNDSFMMLLVLLTTANNPDVTLPAYTQNRLYAVFFIIFLIIGLYCFMNMLTAIIYNQFRGYFLSSMHNCLMRRRLGQRAAFEALKNRSTNLNQSSIEISEIEDSHSSGVSVRDLKIVIARAKISQELKVLLVETIARGFQQDEMLTWNKFLSVLRMMEMDLNEKEKPSIRWFHQYSRLVYLQKIICHRYFSYFGNFMAFVNVVLISFELATEYDKSLNSSQSTLRIINFMFIFYYVLEQSIILFCMGWRRYRYSWASLYDGIIVIILTLSEIVTISLYGFPFFSQKETHNNLTLWNIVRVINILIMLRLLRIIWHIKTMAIVAHTLLDLVKNLQSFGGILIVIYYFFAILGMEFFQNKITYTPDTGNSSARPSCGTYEQLEYWANNFDDFAAAIVVLWDVMVVNNWFVFLDAYAKYTTKWSYLYFIVWWLTSVVIVLNLFTALILENFIMKWDKFYLAARVQRQARRERANSFSMNTLTVHDIFKSSLKEPTEEEILQNMSKLRYFNVNTQNNNVM